MFSSLIEKITGKDDLERIACKEDPQRLNKYLKTRHLLFPKKPRRFLDADNFTQDELRELIDQESKELEGNQIELWILEVDGKKRLPAFSSEKKAQAFAAEMSQELNKVFSLGYLEVLLSEITKHTEIDFIDLNLFNKNSWEIGTR
tara:strand:- start:1145 stop:1582 length:438 start_codon:yes stop_codon:yes gene_type:complete